MMRKSGMKDTLWVIWVKRKGGKTVHKVGLDYPFQIQFAYVLDST